MKRQKIIDYKLTKFVNSLEENLIDAVCGDLSDEIWETLCLYTFRPMNVSTVNNTFL